MWRTDLLMSLDDVSGGSHLLTRGDGRPVTVCHVEAALTCTRLQVAAIYSARIDDEVVQDQRQHDDNDLQDERQDQPKEEEVKPRRNKRARTEKSLGPNFVSFMDTWELVGLLSGCKPLGYKWIFKKMKANGTIDKMVLAITALRKLEDHQMDVKMTFLNEDLEKILYMNQPEGFMAPGLESKVCRLVKSLYGLKKASKQGHHFLPYHVAINNGDVHNLSEEDSIECDCLIHRSYIANYQLVVNEVDSSDVTSLQAVKLLALYLLSPDNKVPISFFFAFLCIRYACLAELALD
nr:zinc finger, CCHC-type [Tanacetum cinerariifolium]